MTYGDYIKQLSKKISKDVVDLAVERKRGTAPTQAFSDFISHNEQGFWAEDLFYNCLSKSCDNFIPVKYGRSDKITAGDKLFKAFYESYQDELDTIGKRPDVLILSDKDYNPNWKNDISKFSKDELDKIVPFSKAAFEVRSSAYLTKKFIAKKGRESLSFTPKVEDLLVILKWINTYGVPHFYVQVFFDSIFILPFAEILEMLSIAEIKRHGLGKISGTIGNNLAFVIEKNPKNQFKETIHIPLTRGIVLSSDVKEPEILGTRKELAGGRLLHHISFKGGGASLDKKLLLSLISKSY